jgi:hypothetical protein
MELQSPTSLAEEATRKRLIFRVYDVAADLRLQLRPPELTYKERGHQVAPDPAEIWRPPTYGHQAQTRHHAKHKH